MFVHKSQLQHVLRPDQYYSEQQYRTELARLFLPGWHFVGTTAELPNHGDFLTLDLFDHPLQVRNIDGRIHAFLNVCAHRHCMLTHEAKGSDPRFRCQYHGWEFNAEGKTGRIPDAQCFRPFDRENARLRKFRAETCGELIFVSLEDDGPSLAEYLGPFHALCAESFAPPYCYAWKWEATYAANWKIPTENSLESYHTPCIHPKTFGDFPSEENCAHELNERFTVFRTPEPESWICRCQRGVVRWFGLTPTSIYTHYHIHPNLIYTSLDVYRMVQLIVPTSPTTTRHVVWLYTIDGPRSGWAARLASRIMARLVILVAKKILLEDQPVFADVQRGMHASVHPGVIGTREERIYVFQKFIADACGDPAERAKPMARIG